MSDINKTVAFGAGIVFTLVGILGYVPFLTPGGALLGLFAVNGIHSSVHLLFGGLGLMASVTVDRLYNRVVGVSYMLIGLLGFIPALTPHGMLIGLIMINPADNLLHIAIGLTLAGVGFLAAQPRFPAFRQA